MNRPRKRPGRRTKTAPPRRYWANELGTVASVDQSNVRYGVTVRFEKVNYQGVNSNNYAVDELIEVEAPTLAFSCSTAAFHVLPPP